MPRQAPDEQDLDDLVPPALDADAQTFVTDAAPTLLSYVDARGRYRSVNRAYEEWFRLSRTDVVGRHMRDVLGEAVWDMVFPYVKMALAGERVHYTAALPYRHGGARHIDATYIPHRGPDGRVLGFAVVVHEVTPLVVAQQEQARLAAVVAEKERLLRAVIDQMPAGVVVRQADGQLTLSNARARELLGADIAPRLGDYTDTVARRLDGSPHPPGQFAAARALHGEAAGDEDVRWLRPDGTERILRTSACPVHDDAGRLVASVGTFHDVTEMHQAQEQLRRNQRLLDAVVEHMPAALFVAEAPGGKLILGNRRVAEVLRRPFYAASGVGEYGYYKAFHPDGRPYAPEDWPLARAVQRGEVVNEEETVIERGDGTRGVFLVSAAPIRDVDGEVTHGVTTVIDITRRRDDERWARLALTIAQNATSALFVMDERQHCTFMNPAAVRLSGYTFEQTQGRPLHDVIHHTRPDGSPYPPSECPIDRALPERAHTQGEDVFVHRDGHFFPVSFTASPILENGRPVGTVIEVWDTTEQKRHEAERQQLLERETEARRAAEEANRLKDEFLATVSHELRTPLSAVLGWVQLLKNGALNPDKKAQALEIIERNARTQAQLIEDLLDVSRIVSGKLTLEVEPVDLHRVAEAALEAVRPAADAKGVHLQPTLGPRVMVMGDPTRLQQVVWNLLSNAVKFTPRGGQVRLHAERLDSLVVLTVADSGQGIEPEFLPHVFDRFRQAEGGSTRRHGGLGLGLSIVRNLVEAHGGTVEATSEGPGRGATFTVRIPAGSAQRD